MVYNVKNKSMVHIRLSPWMYNRIELLSAKLGMTLSDVIRMGINEIIKKELDKDEIPQLKKDMTRDNVKEAQGLESMSESTPKEHHVLGYMGDRVNKEELEKYKESKLKEFVQHVLIESSFDKWMNETRRVIENEIPILEKEIEDFKKSGDTKHARKLEKEVERLRKLVSLQYASHHDDRRTGKTGVLRLAKRNELGENIKIADKMMKGQRGRKKTRKKK